MLRALTALQPSGLLHIGNYFGAMEPAIALQDEFNLAMFIVDYHAITVPQDPKELRKNILFATATYLAAGLNPEKTLLFQQSRVPQHTELAWILQCIAKMGETELMTQFKDKKARYLSHAVEKEIEDIHKNLKSVTDTLPETQARVLEKYHLQYLELYRNERNRSLSPVSVGLFTYPILMAADILLYGTNIVPVGHDQKQHVERTRDLADRFNRDYGETFVVPEPRIGKEGARIMGLDDPTKKMSKSSPTPKSYISLLDDAETIQKKIKSAVTDSGSEVKTGADRPALTNLLTIFSLVTKRSIEDIEADYEGKGYGVFKADLADAIVAYLQPLQTRIQAGLENESLLIEILDRGAENARAKAEETMKKVRANIGVTL